MTTKEVRMRNWKGWGAFGIMIPLLLIIGYIAFNFIFLDFMVDLWWFSSLQLKSFYLMRIFYRDTVFICATLIFSLVFFLNFWVASRFLGLSAATEARLKQSGSGRRQRLISLFQSGSMKIYTPLSLFLGILITIPLYDKWESALLFIGPRSGIADPTFGKDISYFLFQYPVFTLIQDRFLWAFSLLLLALGALYWVEHHLLAREDQKLARGARIHMNLVAAVTVAVQCWGFLLDRAGLVFTSTHEPLFFGPGWIEMKYHLPMIWITLVVFIFAAGILIWYFNTRKHTLPPLTAVLILLVVMLFKGVEAVPNWLQDILVKPNEVSRERPYIENCIQATLSAYGLDKHIEIKDYPVSTTPRLIEDSTVLEALRNVPVWDRKLLDEVYTQLQGFRPFYQFQNVDVDRYKVGNIRQQVYLAAREVSIEKLPESARNWSNQHLQYSHGRGVVMTPAAQGGDEQMTWFMQDIPVRSDYGLSIKRSEIYYGEEEFPYVVVPNDLGEIDYSTTGEDTVSHYGGTGGVHVGSLLKKILFAAHFRDRNLLFTGKTTKKSRILFHRNIRKRIKRITPFFLLDEDPYIVALKDGLFWIQDAYTTSSTYPNAERYTHSLSTVGTRNKEFGKTEFNYIRNSVKIVVDAYNGNVDYYISDPSDPLVRAYARIYPGLLKPISDMPNTIKAHIRYPKQLFSVQMGIYAKYHQTNPDVFYREEDNWLFPDSISTPWGSLKPYYLTYAQEKGETPEFMLVSPMSFQGGDNLRALATVKCDPDNYGEISVLRFPKGQQVFGPNQIAAYINQDTEIAQQLTLWDQAGSQVLFGRMVILPVGGTLLYVQPIYLQAAKQLRIPELKRIMVSQGRLMVLERSLEEGLVKLQEKIARQEERQKQRMGGFGPLPKSAAPQGGKGRTVEPSALPGEKPPVPSGSLPVESQKSTPGDGVSRQ